ncbi:hypothetical protein T05_13520 [Trichinella murrelli]|uniref:Uncharacterized protein n=1 Tax=Trichinella murrelli TaxID=144512 RepID=A0A0V0U813_9BILA|nr:hypothetical protein T05_13520 [Trichinella murrelli]
MLVRAGEQNATLDFGPEPRRSAGSRGRVGVLGQQQVVAHHTAFGHDEHHGQNLAGQRDQVGQGDAGYLAQAISGRGIVASIADVGVFHARRCTDEMLTTKNNNHKSKLGKIENVNALSKFLRLSMISDHFALLSRKIKLIFENTQQYTYSPLNISAISGTRLLHSERFFLAIRAAAVLLFCSSSSAICHHFRLVEFHSDILLLVFIYRIDEPGTYFYKQERFGIG